MPDTALGRPFGEFFKECQTTRQPRNRQRPLTVCLGNAGDGRWLRFSPRWRWPRSTPRLPAPSAATPHVRLRGAGLAFVSLPFYFEDVMGHSQVETGFFMTPWPLVVVIMAPIGGRLSDRFSAGQLGGLGLVLFGIGMVLLATLPTSPGIVNIVRRVVICGIGFGFFQTLNMRAIMSSAPPHRSGGASGIVVTARLIGQTTGAALAALRFSLAGRDGAALALGDGFAGLGSVLSFLRLTVAPRRDA
jgi:MFS transporter, DHA2 family, multidrug resistance protein